MTAQKAMDRAAWPRTTSTRSQ